MLLASGLLVACSGGDVQVESPEVGAADRATCEALLADLPDLLADQERRQVSPDGALGRAWGDPPIVATCGVGDSEALHVGAACEEANGVGWFFPESQYDDQEADLTLTTIGHRPRLELRVPVEYRPEGVAAALAQLAPPVKEHLTKVGDCV